ncbi:LysE family translocator [Burkholderia lata]|uniref:LysE family translocator protein n=1 Tax=Burkholderia lata (strain ATCC 17760 / DSM 23089 / LMG 22485 / NCIMB 9086 / R18194 / 383) TaxID=482957 RepID=A0A6P2WX53_BURL3|nr:LysE family translocator [Burkholderia lata]VWD01367.1 LysE family translocator protein [Burkholderia lata]
MPTLHAMLEMALYISLVLATPGPTNTLLLSSGIKAGFRQSWRLLVAEATGYGFAISLWGFFVAAFAATRPWLYDALKLGSSAYIFYLALLLWKSPRIDETQSSPIGFRDMFVATTMNPKALLFATVIFPAQAFATVPFYLCTISVFTALAVTIGSMWLTIGGVLTARRSLAAHTATLLRGASVVLLMFSGTLFFSVLNR